MRRSISRILLLSIIGAILPARAMPQTPRQSPTETLIRNATILTITHGTLPGSDVLIRGAMPGIKLELGENPKRSSSLNLPGVQRRYPTTRMGVEEVIRDAFTRARDYRKSWDEYRAATSRGEKNLIPPRRDLQLEPL